MPSETPMDKIDVFAPLPLGADAVKRRGNENYNIMVRLNPGVSVKQAQADIDVIASRIREKDKRDASFGMHVIGLRSEEHTSELQSLTNLVCRLLLEKKKKKKK